MKVAYEWCIEIEDENGDIIESNFSDNLKDLDRSSGNLVLVRNEGDEISGVTDRYWAYVKDGKLPDMFSDSVGQVGIAVPKKFLKMINQ